jgi:hypothetical protein
MLIVGLVAASQRENFGFAIGRTGGAAVSIERAGLIATKGQPEALASIIGPLLRSGGEALVAIDAPLGWPPPLGASLANHKAGEKLTSDKHESFCRQTDRRVREHIGKKPVDVGALELAAYLRATRNKNSLFGVSASLNHSFVHFMSAMTLRL